LLDQAEEVGLIILLSGVPPAVPVYVSREGLQFLLECWVYLHAQMIA